MSKSIIFNSLIILFFLVFSQTTIYAQTEGEYFIQSALGGKTLDVQSGISKLGTPLQIWEHNGTRAQKFTLENAGGGYFYIKSGLGPYVHVAGNTKATKTPVTLGNKNSSDNFKWKIKSVGNGYYTIVNKKMNMFLDVQWGSSNNGTPVWMWTHSGTGAQKWKLNPTTQRPIIARPPGGPTAVQSEKINHGLWATLFDFALKDVKIRINNFTSTDFADTTANAFRWWKKDDSEFKIKNDDPHESTFNIFPFRVDPMTIYIHALNLSNARTSHENGKVKITFKFEEQGLEVRTNCVEHFLCGSIGNPNFNLEDPVIVVLFKPVVENGKITYDNAEVRFSGHLIHEGVNIGVELLNAIADLMNFDIDGELSRKGSEYLKDYLNNEEIKNDITRTINDSIHASGLPSINIPAVITNVEIDNNGDLLIYGR